MDETQQLSLGDLKPEPKEAPEEWRAARFVRSAQRCCTCMCRIPRSSPGNKRGQRWAKAFYEPHRRIWECLACHRDRVAGLSVAARLGTKLAMLLVRWGWVPAHAPREEP